MKTGTKEKKSKLTPKQQKILDIVVTVVQVVIIIIAITISAIVIANPISSSAEVSSGSIKLLPVLSDSMNGSDAFYEAHPDWKKSSFKTGDLVIAGKVNDNLALKVGDIVTFVDDVAGSKQLVTHRIVEVIDVENDGKADTYIVRGDADTQGTNVDHLNPNKILAVYKSKLVGVGKAINWLQDATHFLLVIVIPLALLFIYNVILAVRMIMEAKLAKQAEAQEAAASIDAEEIKRKAIEEYLAQQQGNANSTSEETPTEEVSETENSKTEDKEENE